MGNKYLMTIMIAHTLSPPTFERMEPQACLLSRHFQTSSNELAEIYCWKRNTMTATTAEFPTKLPWLVWNYHMLAGKTCNTLKSLPICKISRKETKTNTVKGLPLSDYDLSLQYGALKMKVKEFSNSSFIWLFFLPSFWMLVLQSHNLIMKRVKSKHYVWVSVKDIED